MNPEDKIIIKMLVCQYNDNLKIECRISGIKSIIPVEEKNLFSNLFIAIVLLAAGLLVVCDILNINSDNSGIKIMAILGIVAIMDIVLVEYGRKDQARMVAVAAFLILILLIVSLVGLIVNQISSATI